MKTEIWIVKYWRPYIAWLYGIINFFDFVLFPILNFYFSVKYNIPYVPWNPITLFGAGTFHISFGAILGVTAWTRGQEKINGVNNQNGSGN